MYRANELLVITSCINVNNKVPYVALKNKQERISGYRDTIQWALHTELFDKIIFCDNSGYLGNDFSDLVDLSKDMGKELELLFFKGDDTGVIECGKGYGEGEIMKYVMEHSVLMKNISYFCKITGRVIVKNCEQVLRLNKDGNYFEKLRGRYAVDTRFYRMNKSQFETFFKDSYVNVDDKSGRYLEYVYYDVITKNKIRYKCFYEKPFFDGICGSTGESYSEPRSNFFNIINFLHHTGMYNHHLFWKILGYK